MKVGDLVRKHTAYVGWAQQTGPDLGIVVECQDDTPNAFGTYWRVLFGSELNYVRESDLEVISESR